MDWFMSHYLPDASAKLDPRASPLLAGDLRGVAPAFVTTGGFDPLHDEGLAYAERLHDAGALLGYACLGDAFHGFLSLSGVLAAAGRALADAAAVLRTSL
jgi:acetyl esterase